jgi:hypothetical protein
MARVASAGMTAEAPKNGCRHPNAIAVVAQLRQQDGNHG